MGYRIARSMPLNIMQQAARMDEAVDEQGASAWISPDKGVVIDGEFSDAPRINHDQRGTEELLAPRLSAAPAPLDPIPAGAADAYYERWNAIMNGATNSEQLAKKWNDEADERKSIAWTDEHPFKALQAKVASAISFLKQPAKMPL